MITFFQPKVFQNLCNRSWVWLMISMMFCLNIGYFWALFFSPIDAQQGPIAKIMFIHVPAAWMALMCYACLGLFSLSYLSSKAWVSLYLAQSAARVGCVFTLVCLISGSLWGLPTWGTWWVWDARLTSVLILFFLYLSYLLLSSTFQNQEKAAKFSSALALLGLVNLPIIKWSVDWWSTLHQPASISKLSAPSMHWSFYVPLIIISFGWFCYTVFVMMCAAQTKLIEQSRKNV